MNIPLLRTALCCALLLQSGCNDQDDTTTAALYEESSHLAAEGREQRRLQLEEQGFAEPDTDRLDRMGELAEDAAERTEGVESEMLRKTGEIARKAATEIAAYQALLNDLIDAGGWEAAGSTPENLAARTAMFDHLLSELDRLDQVIPALMSELPMPPDGSAIEATRLIRETDRRIMKAGRALIDIYTEYFGRWELADDGTVLFGDDVPDEIIDQVNAHFAEIAAAAEDQQRLQREVVENIDKP